MQRVNRWVSRGSMLLCGFAVSACSFTRTSADCASNTECRDAFGTGYVCVESGLCELSPVNVACTAQTPADLLAAPEKYRNYVVLGSLLRVEGKEGARNDSAKLAINSVNRYLKENDAAPELQGLQFGLVQCTHDGNVERIGELARYLTDTIQVPAILGPASSSATSNVFKQINLSASGKERRQALMISPSATSVALTSLESKIPGMLWRTAPTDDGQGRLMGEFATARNQKFLAFYEDTPYGRGLYDRLKETSGQLCDDCGFKFDANTSNVVELTQVLDKDDTLLALAEVELVYFMGAQETHLREMMRRLGTEEFSDKIIFFSDAAASTDTVAEAAKNYQRVVGTRVKAADNGEATRFFASAYRGTHDEDPLIHSFTAHSYDAAWLLLLSSLHARLAGDTITAETIGTGMRALSDREWHSRSEETCPIKLKENECPELTLDETYLPQILKALSEEGSVNVQGASGSLNYDRETEELENNSDAFEFWHLQETVDEDVSIIGGKPSE